MSPSDRWYLDTPSRKLPAPEHGIRIDKAGSTWWGRRWIEALESVSEEFALRIRRGLTYARTGRTHDLVIAAGRVTALATGTRPTPYEITLKLQVFSDSEWRKAILALGQKAQFLAELLAGEMPAAIDDVFRTAGTSLFPARESDIRASCSCPDSANPCKHIAATHYVLGQAFDRDPFLLFELRGRNKQRVIAALREIRAAPDKKQPRSPKRAQRAVSNSRKHAPNWTMSNYDTWRAPKPSLKLTLARPEASGALLRQLGKPPGWSTGESPSSLFGRVVREASERALGMALASDEPPHEKPPYARPPEPSKTESLVSDQPAARRARDRKKKRSGA